MKTLSINAAAESLQLTPFYVRKCIREGKLAATLVQIGETKVSRWEINEDDLQTFADRPKKSVGKREDGRNKYTAYLTIEEHAELVEANPDLLIGRANVKKTE